MNLAFPLRSKSERIGGTAYHYDALTTTAVTVNLRRFNGWEVLICPFENTKPT